MKTVKFSNFNLDFQLFKQINETLTNGGLVCIPSCSGYKLLADLSSPTAITAMLQAKRRVKNAPALVFIPDKKWTNNIVDKISDDATKLMNRFWPGQVTLLFKANEELHPKIRKPLTKAKGWLGVRVPSDETSLAVVKEFGKPLLVSSANLAKKGGANSVAQVKKNFGRTVDMLLDSGDITSFSSSTLVDVSNKTTSIIRAGAIAENDILKVLSS